ncbi:citrate lyase holo-[acyl-carrier protein] synthase [Spiroplasma culicicola]|uniref:citrate lyase holo-[acyl-carrier protein] synthase n=1 Tax=Spiroplasma culicicola AES-1 TaxID=1276246 RepID=W6A690_9MOLU|nr:citrate lyase holo-[acyl-carrier protein] synthase [Spiroplasma culicicola]AHI52512.1 hypothetical protein SCULI_v1c01710 [Spiroplasma culicicola AES-1]
MLNDILEAREKRTLFLKSKLENHEFVITFSLNIPGDNKNGRNKKNFIIKYFHEYISQLNKKYNAIDYEFLSDAAGYAYYLMVADGDPYEIKKMSLQFEESLGEIGYLIDIDIYESNFKKISRQDLAEFPRKCFLCEKPAKVCAFKQTHTYEQLNNFIDKKLLEKTMFVLSNKYIYEDIVNKVTKGKIKAGDRLKENNLAQEYGVSRTKIREVLKELEDVGLVVQKKDVGAEIKTFSQMEIIEITDISISIYKILFEDVFLNLTDYDYHIIKGISDNLIKIDILNYDLILRWAKKFKNLLFSLSNKQFTKKQYVKMECILSPIYYKVYVQISKGKTNLKEEQLDICNALMQKDYHKYIEKVNEYCNKLKKIFLEM